MTATHHNTAGASPVLSSPGNSPVRWLLLVVLLVASVFAAWRVIAIHQADRWAEDDPERALRWMPRHPAALLELAERQSREGRHAAAAATARRLLADEPLQGKAYRLIGAAVAAGGDADAALPLYRIAARRSPRDVPAQAWLAEHALRTGDFEAAVDRIGMMLRLAPRQRQVLLPLLAQLAANPRFADALARRLEDRPPWRAMVLDALQRAESHEGERKVLSALRANGGLTAAEWDAWIAALMARGAWNEAYGRWAGTLDLKGGVLPLVYNGGFEQPVSGRGFDWRITRVPGVALDFEPVAGAEGLAAHVRFRGRRVAAVNLQQPLLLPPGAFRFSARMRAERLRSELGLEWAVTCTGAGAPLATSSRIDGSFAWREIGMDIDIPLTGCPGQWLTLRNPVSSGSAQQVAGELWFDEVKISSRR